MIALSRRAALALVLVAPGQARAAAEDGPLVAAAADLRFALDDIAQRFRRFDAGAVRIVYGSSGNLARQIAEGAPYELFLSADERLIDDLVARGRIEDRGELYAVGRIAVFAANDSPLSVDARLDGLTEALDRGRIGRFAIANPEHAPYGRAARSALTHCGLWKRIAPHLVLGENAAQAAQFALASGASGGVVVLSLVTSSALAGRGRHAVLPEQWHEPLRQRMALVKGAGATARRFFAFLGGDEAREILRRIGFAVPGAA